MKFYFFLQGKRGEKRDAVASSETGKFTSRCAVLHHKVECFSFQTRFLKWVLGFALRGKLGSEKLKI
jgi:hypothetical protein